MNILRFYSSLEAFQTIRILAFVHTLSDLNPYKTIADVIRAEGR